VGKCDSSSTKISPILFSSTLDALDIWFCGGSTATSFVLKLEVSVIPLISDVRYIVNSICQWWRKGPMTRLSPYFKPFSRLVIMSGHGVRRDTPPDGCLVKIRQMIVSEWNFATYSRSKPTDEVRRWAVLTSLGTSCLWGNIKLWMWYVCHDTSTNVTIAKSPAHLLFLWSDRSCRTSRDC